jgi:predicted Zn-dependent protease
MSFPADAETALLVYMCALPGDDVNAATIAAQHVLALDPVATQVLKMQADHAYGEGNVELAEKLAKKCIALVPKATYCRDIRLRIENETGRCAEELGEARELVKLEPDLSAPYFDLASALVVSHAPVESVRLALQQATAREGASPLVPEGATDAWLALTRGDFVAADEAALTMTTALRGSNSWPSASPWPRRPRTRRRRWRSRKPLKRKWRR